MATILFLFIKNPLKARLGSPELAKEFPLVLTTGTRIQSAFRSQHLNIPGLLKLQDKPNILIHPEDAERRGIRNGDKVWVKTKRGRGSFLCESDRADYEGCHRGQYGGRRSPSTPSMERSQCE